MKMKSQLTNCICIARHTEVGRHLESLGKVYRGCGKLGNWLFVAALLDCLSVCSKYHARNVVNGEGSKEDHKFGILPGF